MDLPDDTFCSSSRPPVSPRGHGTASSLSSLEIPSDMKLFSKSFDLSASSVEGRSGRHCVCTCIDFFFIVQNYTAGMGIVCDSTKTPSSELMSLTSAIIQAMPNRNRCPQTATTSVVAAETSSTNTTDSTTNNNRSNSFSSQCSSSECSVMVDCPPADEYR